MIFPSLSEKLMNFKHELNPPERLPLKYIRMNNKNK